MNGDVVLRVSDFDSHAFGAKIESFDDALHELEPRAQVVASEHPHRAYLRVWGVAAGASTGCARSKSASIRIAR